MGKLQYKDELFDFLDKYATTNIFIVKKKNYLSTGVYPMEK